jgi:hypothetical protein
VNVVFSTFFKQELLHAESRYAEISERLGDDFHERVKESVRVVVKRKGGDHISELYMKVGIPISCDEDSRRQRGSSGILRRSSRRRTTTKQAHLMYEIPVRIWNRSAFGIGVASGATIAFTLLYDVKSGPAAATKGLDLFNPPGLRPAPDNQKTEPSGPALPLANRGVKPLLQHPRPASLHRPLRQSSAFPNP